VYAHLGAFHLVGGSEETRNRLAAAQQDIVCKLHAEIERLGVEKDGAVGALRCSCTAWKPLPGDGLDGSIIAYSRVSKGYRVVAELIPDPINKRYDIQVRNGVSEAEIETAEAGTSAVMANTARHT